MIAIARLVFWLTGAGLELAVGGLMLRNKTYRKHPLFFAYIVSQVVRFSVLFPLFQAHNITGYHDAYVYLEAVDAVLSFAVIYELYAHTFEPYEGIRDLCWILLRWAAALLAAMAVIAAMSPSNSAYPQGAAFLTIERSVSLVRSGLLFFLFLLHKGLGLRWSRRDLGIALGFAMVAAVELATFTLAAHLGDSMAIMLSLAASASYTCGAGAWLYAVSARAEHPAEGGAPWVDLEGWNRTLLELLHR